VISDQGGLHAVSFVMDGRQVKRQVKRHVKNPI